MTVEQMIRKLSKYKKTEEVYIYDPEYVKYVEPMITRLRTDDAIRSRIYGPNKKPISKTSVIILIQ